MFELLVLTALVFAGIVLFSILGFIAQVLGFLITLPFKIVGALLHLLGFVLALPFLILGAVLGGVGLLVGLVVVGGVLLLPLVPFLLVGGALIWLLRRRPRAHRAAT